MSLYSLAQEFITQLLATYAFRQEIAEYVNDGHVMPATASILTEVSPTQWLAGISYAPSSPSEGVITATAKGDPRFDGQTLLLTGRITDPGKVAWTCTATIEPRYLPQNCKPHQIVRVS